MDGGDQRRTRLAEVCLALPETTREDSGRHTVFRVRERSFAYFQDDHHGDGIVALVCKLQPGENVALVGSDPHRFHLPAYVGRRGWVGLRLDVGPIDWIEVRELVAESYRLTAPKRLAAQVDRPSA